MTQRVAIECFADEDLIHVLARVCGLPLKGLHRFGQGQVVEAVFERGTAEIGIVDEDPDKPHHRTRDATEVAGQTEHVAWRRRGDRHLFLIRPDLETCFLRSWSRFGGTPKGLPERPADLQRLLNRPPPFAAHEAFRRALAALREESRRRRATSFV
ncbi:MAG: hypothetical protein ACREIU_09320, partial [Planctomycetota bacterium]